MITRTGQIPTMESNTSLSNSFCDKFRKVLAAVTTTDCALSMDEMKLKSGLVFKHREGVLAGFVNLGNCNREIELMLTGDEEVGEDEEVEKDEEVEEDEVSDCPLATHRSVVVDR